jgi:hypothetical protein
MARHVCGTLPYAYRAVRYMFRAIPLYSKQKGAYKPIRLRVIRKTEEAKTKGVERLREKKRMKSHRKEPGEASISDQYRFPHTCPVLPTITLNRAENVC